MKKVRGYNSAEYTGYVFSFSIRQNEKTGKKRANIGIRDEKMNNVAYVTMYESPNLKYGDQNVTLLELKKIFMDEDDNPRHILATFSGIVHDNTYTSNVTKKTVTNVESIAFRVKPCSDENKQQIMFNVTGIVDSIREVDDGESYLVKIGSITLDKEKNPNGVSYNRIKISEEAKEKWDDLGVDKGDQITIRGYNLNVLQLDEFGMADMDAKAVKELRGIKIGQYVPNDDLEDYESVYLATKKAAVDGSTEKKVVKKEEPKKKDPVDDPDLPFDNGVEVNDEDLFD